MNSCEDLRIQIVDTKMEKFKIRTVQKERDSCYFKGAQCSSKCLILLKMKMHNRFDSLRAQK